MIEEQQYLFKKYISLLGLKKSKPTYDFLCKIVKAHLMKVPFENISKLLLKSRGLNYIPSLSEFLYGIEKHNFGGTCYANNYYLYMLLRDLDFDVKLCGADMKNPDVHIISIATISNKEYIVDCGYAAPFFNPLPRDRSHDHILETGDELYIIKPKDSEGHTKVEHYFHGKLQHWYTAKPLSRKIKEFKKVIEDSYADDQTFMNAVRITRFTENGSLVLKNLLLTEANKNKTSTKKLQRKDLPQTVEHKFGIPAELVSEAMSHLKELKDIYD